MFTLRTLGFAILALVLGIIGLSMVFSGNGAGESAAIRIVVATLFFFFSGLGIGYFNPRGWIVSGCLPGQASYLAHSWCLPP